MKNFLFALLVFLGMSAPAFADSISFNPEFASDGTVTRIFFLVDKAPYGSFEVLITTSDVALTQNGTGDLLNKTTIKTILKTKYIAAVAAFIASQNQAATAATQYNTRKAKIVLPVAFTDLQ